MLIRLSVILATVLLGGSLTLGHVPIHTHNVSL
jgi:hypothetical protein